MIIVDMMRRDWNQETSVLRHREFRGTVVRLFGGFTCFCPVPSPPVEPLHSAHAESSLDSLSSASNKSTSRRLCRFYDRTARTLYTLIQKRGLCKVCHIVEADSSLAMRLCFCLKHKMVLQQPTNLKLTGILAFPYDHLATKRFKVADLEMEHFV